MKTTPPTYSAEEVRQGETILRTTTQRIIFLGGLFGMIAVMVLAEVNLT